MTDPDFRHTPQSAADRLGISRPTLQKLIEAGDIPAIDISPSTTTRPAYRIREADLMSFIEARAIQPKN